MIPLTIRICHFTCLCALLMAVPAFAQVVEFEVHSGMDTSTSEPSSVFAVRINGQPAPVEFMKAFEIETNGNTGITTGQHHVVHFSMRGPVDIEVDFLADPAPPSYWIRPGVFKVKSSRTLNTVSFTLHVPHYYVLQTEDNGNRHELYLLADSYFENAPAPTDPNVLTASSLGWANDGSPLDRSLFDDALHQIQSDPALDILYVDPGHYNFMPNGLYHRTGVGVFLPGGSTVVANGMGAKWEEAFWLRGRGVLDAGTDAEGRHGKHITTVASRNFLFEGIISRFSSDWNTATFMSDDGLIKDWKVVNSWNWVNNDGVDTNRSRRITVDKYFVSASADNSSDKANKAVSVFREADGFERDVRDITRREGVFHSDAKSLKFGTESDADFMEDFLFENMFAVNNAGPKSHLADRATLRNVTIRNYHVDGGDAVFSFVVSGWAGREPTTANINGMTLDGIFSYGPTNAKLGGYSPSNLVQNVDATNILLGSTGFATNTSDLELSNTASISVDTAPAVWASHDRFGLINDPVPMAGYAYHSTATWTKVSGPGNVAFSDQTDPATTVTFDTRGEYVLRISADSDPGEFDELTVTVLDPAFAGEPKARFIMLPTFPEADQPVTFDGTYSSDPDGSLTAYEWDFGDGTTVSGTNATSVHTYSAPGRYPVRLTVTDNEGNTRTVRDFILVQAGTQPFGGVAHTVPGRVEAENYDEGVPGLDYNDRSAGDGGDDWNGAPVTELYRPVSRFIEEYDRTPVPDIFSSTDPNDPDGFQLGHIDPGQGTNEWVSYTINAASAGTYDITFRVNPDAPNVDRYFSLYLDGNKVVDHAKWPRSGSFINHTVNGIAIDSVGEHTLTIEFEGDIGALNYFELERVGAPVPSSCFTHSPENGLSPLEVTVDATCSDGGGDPLTRYDWDFGDGTIILDGNAVETHTYATDGDYTITLTVTNDSLNTDEATASVFVGNRLPVASFEFSPTNPDAGQLIAFDASVSSDEDGSIQQFDWDFGDGSSIPEGGPTPSHRYASDGSYTVTLTVTDDRGDSTQATASVFVGNLPPSAELTSSPSLGLAPVTVSFDASGATDPDGTIARYDWVFGDGTLLPNGGPTPSHSYTSAGEYTATVTVFDDDGATNSASSETISVFGSSGSSQSWDFEAGSGDRSFGQFGWMAYASPRESSSVIDHTDTGAFPAVIKEDSSLGGSSLALMDANAANNDLSQQFYAGTPTAIDISDAVSFSFTHRSNTGSSSTAPKFLRIAIQVDETSWFIAEQAIAESPESPTTSLFEFDGANWIGRSLRWIREYGELPHHRRQPTYQRDPDAGRHCHGFQPRHRLCVVR